MEQTSKFNFENFNFEIELIDKIGDLPKSNQFNIIKYVEYNINNSIVSDYLEKTNSKIWIHNQQKSNTLKEINMSCDIKDIIRTLFLKETEEFIFGAIIVDIESIISYQKTGLYLVTYDVLLELKEQNKLNYMSNIDRYIDTKVCGYDIMRKIVNSLKLENKISEEQKNKIKNNLYFITNAMHGIEQRVRIEGQRMVTSSKGLMIDEYRDRANILLRNYLEEPVSYLDIDTLHDVVIESYKLPAVKSDILIGSIKFKEVTNKNSGETYHKTIATLSLNKDKQDKIALKVLIGHRVSDTLLANKDMNVLLFYINIFGEIACRFLDKSDNIVSLNNIGSKIEVNKEIETELKTKSELLEASSMGLEMIVKDDIVISIKACNNTIKLPKAPVILSYDIEGKDVSISKYTKVLGLSRWNDEDFKAYLESDKLDIGGELTPMLSINKKGEYIYAKEFNIREGVEILTISKPNLRIGKIKMHKLDIGKVNLPSTIKHKSIM